MAFQLFAGRCIAIGIWFLITVVEWTNNPKSSPGFSIPLLVRAVEAFSILLVSEAVIFSIRKLWRFFPRRYQAMLSLFLAFYVFAIAANVIALTIRSLIGFAPPQIDGYFFVQSLHFYVPLYLVVAIHYLVKHRIDLNRERESKLEAEAHAQKAKWMMLRYQVNPHFLFNTLNSIRALIGQDDHQARKVVTEMSEYFRYSLSIEKKPLVTVREEMAAVDSYLEIQKIRYPQRIAVKREIHPEADACLIPVFSIQTLVENACKYGLKTHEGTVEIFIGASKHGEVLQIRITNTGKLVRHSREKGRVDGTHTGIDNLKKRLEFLDSEYRFQLAEDGPNVIASIDLKANERYENLESDTG